MQSVIDRSACRNELLLPCSPSVTTLVHGLGFLLALMAPAGFAIVLHERAMHVYPWSWTVAGWENWSAVISLAATLVAARLLRQAPCRFSGKLLVMLAVLVHMLFVMYCVLMQYGACPHQPRLIQPASLLQVIECERSPMNRDAALWRLLTSPEHYQLGRQ